MIQLVAFVKAHDAVCGDLIDDWRGAVLRHDGDNGWHQLVVSWAGPELPEAQTVELDQLDPLHLAGSVTCSCGWSADLEAVTIEQADA